MDCKELIEHLHRVVEHKRNIIDRCTNRCCNFGNVLCEAADAIETLLVERDALMQDAIRCDACLHAKECYFNELRRIDCAQSNRGHWQWRGPQKEEAAHE